MPTPLTLLTHGTLGELNVGAKLAVLTILPLIAQLNVVLGADAGLGQLRAEVQAQLEAALQASLGISNPVASLQAALTGALAAVAGLQAALAAGIAFPTVSVTASAKAVVALKLRLEGLDLLLQALLGVKLEGAQVAAALEAALNFGPVALYGATGQPMSALLSQLSGQDYAGEVNIQGSDIVDALFFVSRTPGFAATAAILFPFPPE